MKTDTVWIDESAGKAARKQHGILARSAQPNVALVGERLGQVTGDVCADHDKSVQPGTVEICPHREKQKEQQRPAGASGLQQEDSERGPHNREHVRPCKPVAQTKRKTYKSRNERPP